MVSFDGPSRQARRSPRRALSASQQAIRKAVGFRRRRGPENDPTCPNKRLLACHGAPLGVGGEGPLTSHELLELAPEASC